MTDGSLAGALQGNPLLQVGLPIALAVIMAGVGLTLRPRDFRNTLYYPRALVLGSIAQLVLLPLTAMGLALLLRLPPLIAVGLVVTAACPGGTTSNVLTFLARGNLALSILMTALASLITVMTLPLFTNLALGIFADAAMAAPARLPVLQTVFMLVAIIFVPVCIGMAVRAWNAALAGRLEGLVGAFGLLVLVVLMILIVYQTRHHLVPLLLQAGPAVVTLNLAGVGLGFAAARLAGRDRRDAVTLAIELGVKNSTLGLIVALTMLRSAEIAIPSALYGLLMYLSAIGLIVYGRRLAGVRALPDPGTVPPHVPDDVGFPQDRSSDGGSPPSGRG